MPSPHKLLDALALLVLSFCLFVLVGSGFAGLGLTGIVLTQILAFALPAMFLARSRPTGWQALWGHALRPRTLAATALIACSLWYWNAHWITALGVDWGRPEQAEEWAKLLALNSRPMGLSIVVFAMVPALCEELLHRGIVLPAFVGKLGVWPGLVLSSLLFALMHLDLGRLLPTFVLGMMAGHVRLRTGSLRPAILLHLLYNSSLLVASTLTIPFNHAWSSVALFITLIGVYFLHKPLISPGKSKSKA